MFQSAGEGLEIAHRWIVTHWDGIEAGRIGLGVGDTSLGPWEGAAEITRDAGHFVGELFEFLVGRAISPLPKLE